MIQDAQLHLLLTQEHLQARVPAGPAESVPVVCLERTWSEIAQERATAPLTSMTPENLAYVIYTSGSTGKPKGTLVPHRGFASLAHWQRQIFQLQAPRRVLQSASFSFDTSVWEIIMALLSGGTLHLPAPDLRMIGMDLLDVLLEQGIERVTLTPSALATLPLVPLPDLRTLIAGAEDCPVELMRAWAKGRTFINAYGPTETTIGASAGRCEASQERMHIGWSVTNTRFYVLDRHLEPVPIGMPGELYIGGAGVTRGYLGRPDLTAERFIADPFGTPEEGGRLYRTGDLVRSLMDGNIEFLGRVDQQVKLHGYRIELGEIEAVLGQHPQVQSCVAVVREHGSAGKQLVAYVVPKTSTLPDRHELVSMAQEQLPAYMVPKAVVLLEELPLTLNGKVDYRALLAPAVTDLTSEKEYVAPETEIERMVAGIWSSFLDGERVGMLDNFFELGGHSLTATRVISSIRQALQIEIPLQSLFETQTLAEFVQRIEKISAFLKNSQDIDEELTERETGAL
jgi:amino acid adenylation domain-containing protein